MIEAMTATPIGIGILGIIMFLAAFVMYFVFRSIQLCVATVVLKRFANRKNKSKYIPRTKHVEIEDGIRVRNDNQ